MRSRVVLEANDIWPEIRTEFNDRLGPEGLAQIDEDGERLGLVGLSGSPDVFHHLLEETKSVGGTAGILTNIRVARRYFRSTVLIMLAVLLAALACFFGYVVFTRVAALESQVATFFAGVAGVSALIGAIGVLLTGIAQNQASRALRRLREHEALLAEIVQNHEAAAKRGLSEALEELERVRTAVAESDARLAAARRTAAVAKSRVDEFRDWNCSSEHRERLQALRRPKR